MSGRPSRRRPSHTSREKPATTGGQNWVAFVLAALISGGCARLPEPPAPLPSLDLPPVRPVGLMEGLSEINAPQPLPPRVRWSPERPGEGTVVAIVLEPESRGVPLFEVHGRVADRDLKFIPLSGGAYLALVPAPLSRCASTPAHSCPAQEVSVEVGTLLHDGTRLRERLALRVEPREFPATRLSVASRYTAPDERTLQRIRREQEMVALTLRTASEEPLWRGDFILPREGVTTSPYGQRRIFNNELRSRHTGHDIDGDYGDPVFASNSGRVALSRDLFYNGNAIFLDHGLGFYTGYFHLSERLVDEGEWVDKGQLIGRVGATGRVTGPHLHWGVYLNAVALDPLSLLEPGLALVGQRFLATPLEPPATY